MSHAARAVSSSARLRPAVAVLCAAALVLACTRPVRAWGYDVHRFIADRAIDQLPRELRPFFDKYRVQVAEHAIDPDLWRNAGFEEEPPRHFLDLDAYGAYPFDALPHDYDQAVAKYGKEMIHKNGLLPWRSAEMYGKLVGAFADLKRGRSFALDNVKFFTSVIAHYASDAHVPFHAVINYDGQLTGQHGLHARFETQLFERYGSRLNIRPVTVVLTKDPREFIFDTLSESARLVDGVLAADREAIGSGEVYDTAYFDRFFAKAQPTLERRISDSIGAVVALVTRAWEEGGKPELPLSPQPRDVRKRVPQ